MAELRPRPDARLSEGIERLSHNADFQLLVAFLQREYDHVKEIIVDETEPTKLQGRAQQMRTTLKLLTRKE
jgi:hypothetical protein